MDQNAVTQTPYHGEEEYDNVHSYKLQFFKESIERSLNRYPFSDKYIYETGIETIDFDDEMNNDLNTGNGFIVSPTVNIKKDLKDPDGIFSYRFGQTLGDVNQYIFRYKCRCGKIKHRINHGMTCPDCGSKCEFVDDNFEYFGWILIERPYAFIHPAYYIKLESFFGRGEMVNGAKRSKLQNIIDYVDLKDLDGHSMLLEDKPKNEPYFGLGIIDFMEKFDEIMDYYLSKKAKKDRKLYDDIMENKSKIFQHSIPVFTTLLRPTDIKDNTLTYEPTNAIYMMINRLATSINKNNTRFQKDKKRKNQKLYQIQTNIMELYYELESGLSGKKGDFRCLMGGRYNFSSRNVIVQNPNLRIDQITLPYVALVIMLEQRIKNILNRLYNISFADAHQIWYRAMLIPDDRIKGIIRSIIQSYRKSGLPGIPAIINRNPTIGYGSILQMFIVDFTDTYTMGIPLQPLPLLGADFDGDVLNILLIINKVFFEAAYQIYNPRNAFYISMNDGYFNLNVCPQRDTLINSNTLVGLGRNNYTPMEWDSLMAVYQRNQELYY